MVRFKPRAPQHAVTAPAAGSNRDSVLAFSLAKAGSTLLFDILQEIAPHISLTYFSVEDKLFSKNISPNRRPGSVGNIFNPQGFIFGGFRQYPAYRIPIVGSRKGIFLVRDPRDMATSLYFSMKKSHVLPTGEQREGARAEMLQARRRLAEVGIDRWICQAAVIQYTRMFEGYLSQGILWRSNFATYRYEDIIFNKEEWISDVCDWFGWPIDRVIVRQIVQKFDVVPSEERPEEHIRQVAPGDHMRHLSEAAIETLNNVFGEYLRLFGYKT